MTTRARESSPQAYARIGGTIYVVIIMLALFGLYSREGLIVSDDAAATADNIMGSEMLFLAGLAGEMLSILGDVTLTLILYVLLRPVSRTLALLAAFLRLTFNSVYAVSKLFLVATLIVLGDATYLNALDAQQLHALAYLSLSLHAHGYSLSLMFFGFNCLLLGYLIVRSGYLPRIIGVLLVLGGGGLPDQQLLGDHCGSGIHCEPVPRDPAAARFRRGVGTRPVARCERGRCARVGSKSTGGTRVTGMRGGCNS